MERLLSTVTGRFREWSGGFDIRRVLTASVVWATRRMSNPPLHSQGSSLKNEIFDQGEQSPKRSVMVLSKVM